MDLIIKPTQQCNFACEFCSSNKITEHEENTLPLKNIFDFLLYNQVSSIIVNGGDPLMMPPSYYESIIKFIYEHNISTRLSLTTNLWDFKLHPDKWVPLFKCDLVGVTTSFQYGGERKLKYGIPFTEKMFVNVMDLFYKKIGYMPEFISVITEKNENDVIKTVQLAKRFETRCKINPAVQSGRCIKFYPIHKAFKKYLDIIEFGLSDYEFNASVLKDVMSGKNTCCPYLRDCFKYIRTINPDGKIFTCGSFQDDSIVSKNYDISISKENEIQKDYQVLKSECYACEMFSYCNSCYKQIADIKNNDYVKKHCIGMKKQIQRKRALLG